MATNFNKLNSQDGTMESHPLEVTLFQKTGWITFVWLVLRLWLGWQWLQAGWGKITGSFTDGNSLLSFWQGAIKAHAAPHPTVAFDWYSNFLQTLVNNSAQTWFAPLVAWGEFLIGLGLILGLFTGVAALFAAFMNLNFMLAGSAGVNPLYFFVAMLLLMAWKNSGWWGLDRFVLPALGTPWRPGKLFKREASTQTPAPQT